MKPFYFIAISAWGSITGLDLVFGNWSAAFNACVVIICLFKINHLENLLEPT